MTWKKWLLPLLCALMVLINGGQLMVKLSQPDHGSLLGQGLMALFWLALGVLSLRGALSGKKNGEDKEDGTGAKEAGMKRKRKPWQRWIFLAVALGEMWVLYEQVREYRWIVQVNERANIFSEAALAEQLTSCVFSCAIYGLLAVNFFFQFLIWNRDETRRKSRLIDRAYFSCMTALWAGLWLACPLGGWRLGLWLVILAVLLGGALSCWYRYFACNRKTNQSDDI